MASLTLHDHDGSSGASDQDTLAPLPHPGVAPWPLTFPYQYPIPHPYNPHPVHDPTYSFTAGGGSAGSPHSEGETAFYLGQKYLQNKKKMPLKFKIRGQIMPQYN